MKFRLIAAAVLSSMLAGPAMAQAVINDPAYCSNPDTNCKVDSRGNPYTGNYQPSPVPRPGDGDQNNSYGRRDDFGHAGAFSNTAPIPTAPIRAPDTPRLNSGGCMRGQAYHGDRGDWHVCQ